MKDIGSIFAVNTLEISNEGKQPLNTNLNYYALCREAFLDIIKNIETRNKVALLPAYTCSTVVHPFLQEGWTIVYYKVKKDLTIDNDDIIEKARKYLPDIVVFHPYYGTDLEDNEEKTLNRVKQYSGFIIEDVTQCIYSTKKYSFVDFKVGSLRKWYPIPDGAFLETKFAIFNNSVEEFTSFSVNQLEAMYLRNAYFQTGDESLKKISIRLNKLANTESYKEIATHSISYYSLQVLKAIDVDDCRNKRLENFSYLASHFIETASAYKAVDRNRICSAPLYFPIYATDRVNLQKKLAANHIYAPILWPLYDEEMLIDEEIKYIYDHILLIPCDQRYDIDDMNFIISVIEKND